MNLTAARSAVRQAAASFAALIDQIDDSSVRPEGCEWTVTDIAAHVTGATEAYAGYVRGDTPPIVDVSHIAEGSLARTSAEYLAGYPQREPHVLAPRLRLATDELLRVTEDREIDEPLQWHGEQITTGGLFGLLLIELLLHGADIASALARPWEITRDAAGLALAGAFPSIGLLVNPATTAGVHRSFEVRLRGTATFVLRVDDGSIVVRPASGRERVDCRVSADPVALLLVAYGRTSQWRPILTGKLVAWGRRPWLGLRLSGYLVAP